MEQKDFQAYFASDYKGVESLLNEILLPVFGNDFDKGYDTLTDDPVIKEKASYANIDSIRHAGDIHSLGFDIKVYDVTLCDNCKIERSRQGIQSVIRQFINRFESAFMVFHYQKPKGRLWRLSYVEKLATAKESTSAKRYTYICGAGSPCRTIAERFHRLQSVDKTAKALLDAFSVESLSDEFFAKYKAIYANFVQYITGKRVVKVGGAWEEKPIHEPNSKIYDAFDQDDKRIRDYIKKTMGRVTFLYFLQRKGWLNGDPCFMQKLFADSKYQDDFLDRVLEPLFYTILNTDKPDRKTVFLKHNKEMDGTKEVEWDIDLLEGWEGIPFLNGGLFERDENDIVRTQFPKEFFHNGNSADNFINSIPVADYDWKMVPGLLDFFDQYNFTIDENDPDDAEVGVDPEMLGKVFENLLEDNKDKGAFYTPKEIVQYMCRESLIAYLQTDAADDGTKQQLRLFVENPFESTLSAELAKSTLEKIQNVKICDPAIGSGAFPMGLLNLLVACTESLNAICGVKRERIDTKKHIIQNSIYGVDIERGAIDIARLRFWLSIVVDSTGPEPLPNFDYKFMQGNSLLEQFEGVDLSNLMSDSDAGSSQLALSFGEADTKKNIKALMNSYFNEKDHTRKAQLRDQIDMQVKEHVRLLTEGRADIAQHLQDIPVSANQHFFLWHTWFNDVFKNGGFDIVIGNPPYIQLQNNGGLLGKSLQCGGFESFASTGDIYCLFYEKGWQLLKNRGHLCFITSNKWMRAGYGEKLRAFFATKTNPKQLIDFAGVKIFDSATVDTNILLFEREKNQAKTTACVTKDMSKNDLSNLSIFILQHSTICEFDNSGSWVILSPIEQSIKQKIEAVGTPLKDWNIQINYGIKTGFNDAFIISTEKRDEILANCATDEERTKTAELIRPILRGRDIKRYGYEWAELWLVATFPSRHYDIEEYPALKNHLLSFGIERLEQTGKKYDGFSARKKTNNKWFETQDSISYWDDFCKPKIMYPNMTKYIPFYYDEKGFYQNDKSFMITGQHTAYLTAFLNSSLFKFCFLDNFPELQGGTRELRKIFFDKIPVLQVNDEVNVAFKDALFDIQNEYTKSKAISIDEMIFDLYKLSKEERDIIGFIEIQ